MRYLSPVVAACVLAGVFALQADADGTPSADDIVQALKPIKTRNLRNLMATPSLPETPKNVPPPSIALTIDFDFNSSHLSPDSRATLKHLADALKSPDLAGGRFMIEGHTDAKGRDDYNLKLSTLREAEVRRELVAEGVNADALQAVGKGARELANQVDPYSAENRRVRIVNLTGN